MAHRLSPEYRPRDPTQTVLYQLLDRHLTSFIDEVEAAERPLPEFVRRELEGFGRCGLLEWGFARQKCPSCSFERLIGLSCGGRGFCPSCQGKRMVAGAARLVDHIFPPRVPVRQWVCSFPVTLRFAMAFDHELCSLVIGIFVAEVMRWQRHTAKRELGLASVTQAHSAAIVATHRAGSSLNLQPHAHGVFVDGVFIANSSAPEPALEFRAMPGPTREELREVAARAYVKTKHKLQALGRDWEEVDESSTRALDEAAGLDHEPLLFDCAEASVRGVGLLGEQSGVSLAPRVPGPLAVPVELEHLGVDEHPGGFNLHAGRRVSADDRKGLERLLRYVLHPVLAHDRLEWTGDGNVRLRFTRPWRNGVDAMVLEPKNLIARLVPLVPRPGTHQLRYYGLFARRAALRRLVVPRRPKAVAVQMPMFDRQGKATSRARHDERELERQPNTASQATPGDSSETETPGSLTTTPPAPFAKLEPMRPMRWAEAQRRMGDYNVEACPRCGARLAPVVVVLDPDEIRRTLEKRSLGGPVDLLSEAPIRGPPRGQLPLPFVVPAGRQAPAAA